MQMDIKKTTLGHLRIELLRTQRFMNPDFFDLLKSQPFFEHLPELLRELWNSSMEALEEAMDTREMTVEEAAQAIMVGEAPENAEIVEEIPKSLPTS